MEQTTTPQTFGELLQLLARQQTEFQAMMQQQYAASEARIDALASWPTAARKHQPPIYQGNLNEDLEVWFFAMEQYYAYYHPQMTEASSQFVTMASTHLGVTPLNWYRQISLKCEASGRVKSEYRLRERLRALSRHSSLHDYVAEFQNLLIQCTVPISQLELRFHFQQGLKPATANHICEHHPSTLDETIQLAMKFDQAGKRAIMLDKDWQDTATCHRCKKVGHIVPNCPSK
ncbi:hypothetical protein F444_22608 [Phytophthora nicotianae P1976]|uniref:CCHC-type domain-containing protein n=1 Tax=Phytophthora nicotianae P1976 TaxID=1317066 RepID=A0A080YXA3_PHYNI|nr:hypothetical protein F444_22608 [Phytophthora nicotianae P1976]